MGRKNTKKLLVEGKEDQFAISGLMSSHIEWGDSIDDWPVYIEVVDGIDNLLAEGVIPTYLKSSEVDILGVIIDN